MRRGIRFLVPLLILSLSAAVGMAHGTEVHELVRMAIDVHTGVGVTVNGTMAAEKGFIYIDRTYLPVRAVAEALGVDVAWDGDEKVVSLTKAQAGFDDVSATADAGIKLAEMRKATAKYLDMAQARSDGFKESSGMLPSHGYHYINTLNVLSRLDLAKPSGLIYIQNEGVWQLAALEYAAIFKPSQPLLPGGEWARHDAACHYADGNELFETNVFACPDEHPRTGSSYVSWHPGAWTFHVWAWYPNPLGLYAASNPLLAPYNVPGVDAEHHHH